MTSNGALSCFLMTLLFVGKPVHMTGVFSVNHFLTIGSLFIDVSEQSVGVIANRNKHNDKEDDLESDDELEVRGLLDESVQEVLEVPLTGEYEDDNKPSKNQ